MNLINMIMHINVNDDINAKWFIINTKYETSTILLKFCGSI